MPPGSPGSLHETPLQELDPNLRKRARNRTPAARCRNNAGQSTAGESKMSPSMSAAYGPVVADRSTAVPPIDHPNSVTSGPATPHFCERSIDVPTFGNPDTVAPKLAPWGSWVVAVGNDKTRDARSGQRRHAAKRLFGKCPTSVYVHCPASSLGAARSQHPGLGIAQLGGVGDPLATESQCFGSEYPPPCQSAAQSRCEAPPIHLKYFSRRAIDTLLRDRT